MKILQVAATREIAEKIKEKLIVEHTNQTANMSKAARKLPLVIVCSCHLNFENVGRLVGGQAVKKTAQKRYSERVGQDY